MKAIVISGAHTISLQEIPIPSPQDHEVLIKVKAVGICGTDLEVLEGSMGYFTAGKAEFPVVPGHEWSGEVVSAGSKVQDFAVGDRVVGETAVPCWSCDYCASGRYTRCATRTETGIMHRQGACAEFIAFPARSLHRVADSVPFRTAALIEPSAVAVNAVKNSVQPGEFVVVLGDGPIALLVLQAAKNCIGARRVALIGNTRRAPIQFRSRASSSWCSATGRLRCSCCRRPRTVSAHAALP
eukprot:TRINITY_DN700_c0_g1_i1.p1 TRINITY_DN700_c0_g1~~TRINITY_DN700_c0_g1_i1.p1  ORF type:complete len:252 (+),score=30.32 TRINITY_DN700_c0_g1_i1:35-757(+)